MKSRFQRAVLTGVAILAAPAPLGAAPVAAHEFYASMSEVALNERTGEMEIIHRLFADDLMLALGEETLDEASFYSDPDHISEIGVYVASVFRVADPSGMLYDATYVGAELDGEFAWVYFVADAPDDQTGFIVDNDLLAETFHTQANMTNFRFNSQVRTAMQGPGRRDPVRVRFD